MVENAFGYLRVQYRHHRFSYTFVLITFFPGFDGSDYRRQHHDPGPAGWYPSLRHGRNRRRSSRCGDVADLIELGRTSVAVVCAGVKSILDIGKTLEVLETHGVTVATLGSSDAFPAFYTPDSGFKSPCHLSTIENAARLIDANLRLRLKSGIVIAVPIPEEHAADGRRIQEAIDQALTEAREQGIRGNGETPFLLKRIAELTKDESLKSNIALVKHNAAVGSQIAVKLSEIQAREIQAKEIQAREIQAKKDEKTFKGHENFVQASSPAATKQQETPLSEMLLFNSSS
ncbi:hypothetical protein BC936DRAFT_136804 [Jimgerdemannia flammicorona]|uniref:Indigoidine synthase A like protein-domain-containing protein n=1 Tax=Jimgerdemannia flammicorona TaxID=994334 RepID=A0A433CYR2_9FUNG|nr:hypothetical protein BC936DRAFT_136804 [Jimgerdemannia flammicorona]